MKIMRTDKIVLIEKTRRINIYKLLLILLISILNLWAMHLFFVLNGYMEDVLFMYSYVVNLCTTVIDVSIILFVFLCLSLGKFRISTILTYLTTLIWFIYQCLLRKILLSLSYPFCHRTSKRIDRPYCD